MKKIICLLCIFICMFVFTSCYEIEPITEDTNESNNVETSSQTVLEYSYGFGLLNPEEIFYYTGEPIEITLKIENDLREMNLGFIVLINGIAHEYDIVSFSDPVYKINSLKYITVEEASEVNVTISVTPKFGKAGDILYLEIGSMINPDYIPTGEYKSFGNNHKSMILPQSQLVICEDVETEETISIENITQNKIYLSENIKEQLGVFVSDDVNYYDFKFASLSQEGTISSGPIVECGDDRYKLRFISHGTKEIDVMVNVFFNHELIKIFPLNIQPGYVVTGEIELEELDPKENDFVYVILSPKETNFFFSEKILTEYIQFENNNDDIINESSSTLIARRDENTFYSYTSAEIQIEDLNGKILYHKGLPKDIAIKRFQMFDEGIAVFFRTYDGKIKYSIYDKYLVEQKSDVDVSEYMLPFQSPNHITITEAGDKIALISHIDNHIYISNIDFEKLLRYEIKYQNQGEQLNILTDIKIIEDDYYIITGVGKNGDNKNYVAITDFAGNIIEMKEIVGYKQSCICINNTALWLQEYGEEKGELLIFKDNKFLVIKTEEDQESLRAILSNNSNYVLTFYSDLNNEGILCFSLYDIVSGKKVLSFTEDFDDENASNLSCVIDDIEKNIYIRINTVAGEQKKIISYKEVI